MTSGCTGCSGVLGRVRGLRGFYDRIDALVDLAGAGAVVGVFGIPGSDRGVIDRDVDERQRPPGSRAAHVGKERLFDGDFVPTVGRSARIPVGDPVNGGLVALFSQLLKLPDFGFCLLPARRRRRAELLPFSSTQVRQVPAFGSTRSFPSWKQSPGPDYDCNGHPGDQNQDHGQAEHCR
jgi:hypothetical protein